ncbi:tyrosine-protein phosphatase non-receptor type 6 [Capsaspora owczarzaki ATCC 30864]|uniref:protein-tyrosine-phosphatase n=1 Tax=Capsaspora owczarzaki (strain ATCC 30864) TaxID=595528 RepID=A0A0D2U4T1_CAPO3|nr:tyrosine-protein phosphatase non-receptor type 6 [Capsaspora owczarzaki ATCC 30864]KJE90141.1 tyrosine-protein phosphatase non-receptor type 6 [Capsaspora owczarzaki ATCC 30864]|eukprot:XP_004364357.1 tyrosine-protein phosphatase non-receptor type 6 [Capsaspora owczarzaki ATCC 30864]
MNVHQFQQHFKQLKAKDETSGLDGFDLEFIQLRDQAKAHKDNNTFPAQVGQLPQHRAKNRYRDILPYDATRVRLPPIPGVEDSDYINGNYITGYDGSLAYIATQGPVDATVADFWRMIVTHKVRVIIMLAKIFEDGKKKCAEYWPETTKTEQYGDVLVYNEADDDVSADYTCRKFRVTTPDHPEPRSVYQYHYTAWPDHGIPSSATSLLHMIAGARKVKGSHSGPIAVHCSAGCGRTGTVITIDTIWEILQHYGLDSATFDVLGIVAHLRTQRLAMVQTNDQLMFCYQSAATLIKSIQSGEILVAAVPRTLSLRSIDGRSAHLAAEAAQPAAPPPQAIYAVVDKSKTSAAVAAAAAPTGFEASAQQQQQQQQQQPKLPPRNALSTSPPAQQPVAPPTHVAPAQQYTAPPQQYTPAAAAAAAPAPSTNSTATSFAGFAGKVSGGLSKLGNFGKSIRAAATSVSSSSSVGGPSGTPSPPARPGADQFAGEDEMSDDVLAQNASTVADGAICPREALQFPNRVRTPVGPRDLPETRV